MSMFTVHDLDVGVVNSVPANQPLPGATNGVQTTPAGVVAAAANVATGAVGATRICAALDEPLEYAIVVPATKIDGTTATTGTITVAVQWKNSAGSNTESQSYGPYTLAGGGMQVVRLFPPQGSDRFVPTHTLSVSGGYGQYTAGVVDGAHRINRAF